MGKQDGMDPGARIAELLDAYLGADYRWEIDGQWHPLRIGAPAPELERVFPHARSYGLLSAWNPHSRVLPDAVNRGADEALHAALRDSGLPFRPGFSAARNRSWREPSWVVIDMAMPVFDALTRRFGQLGTLTCLRGGPVRLRMHADRPVGVPAHPAVDWIGERSGEAAREAI